MSNCPTNHARLVRLEGPIHDQEPTYVCGSVLLERIRNAVALAKETFDYQGAIEVIDAALSAAGITRPEAARGCGQQFMVKPAEIGVVYGEPGREG